jgi:gliding motility-associated-like protein
MVEAGPTQIVCGPKVTMAAVPSYGTGGWSLSFPSSQVVASTANSATMSFTLDSTTIFSDGVVTKKFYWEESNWQCKRRDSVDITFYRRPSAIFAGNDTTLYSFDNVIHLKNDPPAAWEEGSWTRISGSGEISGDQIYGLSADTNKFVWEIKNRLKTCSISDLLKITVFPIDIPKGISPNGDGLNDSLPIRGLDLVNQDVEFTILNSAGAKVFSASSFSGDTSNWRSWDGKTTGGADLPEGTYYYLLKMISRNDKPSRPVELLKGYVILKRRE